MRIIQALFAIMLMCMGIVCAAEQGRTQQRPLPHVKVYPTVLPLQTPKLDPKLLAPETHTTKIKLNNSGAFVATARMDGHDVRVIIDTGAWAVALTPKDAEAIGFKIQPDLPAIRVATQLLGTVAVQQGIVKEISLGHVVLYDVLAVLLPVSATMSSLIGMTFLERLFWHYDPLTKEFVLESTTFVPQTSSSPPRR